MDLNVRQELKRAGLEPDWPERLQVPIEFDAHGRALPLGEEVPVADDSWRMVHVKLKPISRLWTVAEKTPLPLKAPPRHDAFLHLLQSTAVIYCTAMDKPETDAEFERLYLMLRLRPDGLDCHPLFSYLQGAARLYLSLCSVSRAEYEDLLQRLCKLAQRFRSHPDSTGYHDKMLSPHFGS
ncbi:MAG TPA: hypothetical protein VFZ09_09530 [Archangium sp.]|uniref:hypothetical protein n=1 Tax=Archangium sp. TaxID=1872627 RepID=UPI002E356DF9|nr:hypothetical protein [Archangium sp.]HEX5746474.1 hypothetical protein [Archangium sp.]